MVNYKSKYLAMKLKYINAKNKLKGGVSELDETQLDEILKNCNYNDITGSSSQDSRLTDIEDVQKTFNIINRIDINYYDHLIIHFGGECSTDLCLKIRQLKSFMDEIRKGKKILFIVIDSFVNFHNIEQYNENLQELVRSTRFIDGEMIEGKLDLQHIKMFLSYNPECPYNKLLNSFITNIIERNGLVVIINSMVYIDENEVLKSFIDPQSDNIEVPSLELISQALPIVNTGIPNLLVTSEIFFYNKKDGLDREFIEDRKLEKPDHYDVIITLHKPAKTETWDPSGNRGLFDLSSIIHQRFGYSLIEEMKTEYGDDLNTMFVEEPYIDYLIILDLLIKNRLL